jgi:sigma-B regulation protein RsbU (phosphoserine phosphatase)
MYATILSSLRVFLQLICVIVVVTCFLTRSRFVIDVPDDHPAIKKQNRYILVFGILSIYGTLTDGKMLGALVNVREPGLRIMRVK